MPKGKYMQLSPDLKAAMAIAVAANLIAFLVADSSREIYFVVALGTNVVGIFVFTVAVFVLAKWKGMTPAYARAAEQLDKIRALPIEQARREALALISDPKRFRCIAGQRPTGTEISLFGPILEEFLARFDAVEQIDGEFTCGRHWTGTSAVRSGFMRIGHHFDGAELAVLPGDDQVFIIHDPIHELQGLPSIYHQILLLK